MMESYCFDALEKGYVSNEIIAPSESIIRSKYVLMGWEFKPPFSSYDNNNNAMLVSNQQSLENPNFPELGIAEIIRKQFPHDIDKNVFNNDGSMGDIITPSLVPSLVTSNGGSGDEDSSSKISGSVVDSSSRESSLIDLKLGGLGDNNMNSSSCRKVPNSAESTTPVKRVRIASLSSQTVYCQVYGCHKDLSSAKDYHKRHKVCDAHTKTSKVVVNGIEQRFCQQCSRFHLLGEFDDGKRSCRKRLAGHNERRRKPQVAYNSGRAGRSFSFRGSVDSKYQGTLAAASFICQDMFVRGPCHADKYRINDWSRHVKIENGIDSSQNSANNFINRQLQGSSVSSPSVLGKQYPSNDNNGRQTVLEENVPQYPHETVPHSMVQMNSFGSEDLTLYDAASTVQGLSGVSESGCALSLLSSQSLNSPAQSSRMPGVHTLTITSSNPNYSVNEVSEKGFVVGSDLTREIQSRYPAYGISPFGRDSDTGLPMPSDGDTGNSGFGNKNIRDSEFVITKNDLPYEGGTTIDLLQLSSQLHRVENQRQSAPGKQESEGFCGLRMT